MKFFKKVYAAVFLVRRCGCDEPVFDELDMRIIALSKGQAWKRAEGFAAEHLLPMPMKVYCIGRAERITMLPGFRFLTEPDLEDDGEEPAEDCGEDDAADPEEK